MRRVLALTSNIVSRSRGYRILLCRRGWRAFTVAVDPPNSFYEHHGSLNRLYWYRLDDRGQLFLEQTLHEVTRKQMQMNRSGSTGRNPMTALKDQKFLNFFYSQLKINKSYLNKDRNGQHGDDNLADPCNSGINVSDYCNHYPLVSLCGKEKNYLLPDDPKSVLGFTDLDVANNALMYTSTKSEPFNPESLLMSDETGRMYHPITKHPHLKGLLGLLHPHLAQNVTKDLAPGDSGEFVFTYLGVKYSIHSID
jgi:hypothetical protein